MVGRSAVGRLPHSTTNDSVVQARRAKPQHHERRPMTEPEVGHNGTPTRALRLGWQPAFLAALRETGIVRDALPDHLKIDRSTAYPGARVGYRLLQAPERRS